MAKTRKRTEIPLELYRILPSLPFNSDCVIPVEMGIQLGRFNKDMDSCLRRNEKVFSRTPLRSPAGQAVAPESEACFDGQPQRAVPTVFEYLFFNYSTPPASC